MSLSLLSHIGNTPLIKITKLKDKALNGVQIYAKAEWFNPGGSVKDRPALRMLQIGEERGELTKDKIIMDSTSGNTGIAYALIGAVKGYKVSLVMPSNVSEERKRIVKAYGAEIIFTSPLEGSDGAIREARRLYKEEPHKYFMPDQYNNPANPEAHYETTGKEIIKQTNRNITHFLPTL